MACIAVAQHVMPGAISTARKSPLLFDRLSAAIGVGFFAGCSREISPSSTCSTLIMYAKDPLIRVLSIIRSNFFPRVAQFAHDGNSAIDRESSRICGCEQCDGYLTTGCCKLNGWFSDGRAVRAPALARRRRVRRASPTRLPDLERSVLRSVATSCRKLRSTMRHSQLLPWRLLLLVRQHRRFGVPLLAYWSFSVLIPIVLTPSYICLLLFICLSLSSVGLDIIGSAVLRWSSRSGVLPSLDDGGPRGATPVRLPDLGPRRPFDPLRHPAPR